MIAPNAQLRQHFKLIRTDGKKRANEARIPVLLYLLFSSNKRLRAWPGIAKLTEDTGYSKPVLQDALEWLEQKGAIYNVPSRLRVGAEAKPHANTKVWQLTGIIVVGEKVIEYFYMKPEEREATLLEIVEYGVPGIEEMYRKAGLLGKESLPKLGKENSPENENRSKDFTDKQEIGKESLHISKENKEVKKKEEVKRTPPEIIQFNPEPVKGTPQGAAKDEYIEQLSMAWEVPKSTAKTIFAQMFGTSKAEARQLHAIEKPLGPNEIFLFKKWYKAQFKDIDPDMPLKPETLARYVHKYHLEATKPAAPAHPSHRPAQLDTQQEQAPEVVAANLAMLDDLDAVEPSMEESA